MKINKKKIIKRGIIALLLAGVIAVYFSNRYVKTVGFENLGEFISNYWSNKKLANGVEPDKLRISISNSDFKFIEDKRTEALDRGVQINVGDNYVPCELEINGEKIDAEIRLKGHMTDHLEGDKWSYRVKSDKRIMGMYRFSLQHPGTRNYAYEWVYHQLLAKEDVIHLKYDFVNVVLRDKDLGVYAVEEHFGQHVLEHNNRPEGAILRWNPNLYWEWRIDELDGRYLNEEYSAYTSSFAEPYDRGTVKSDPKLVSTYKKGASLLEAFRRDSLTASEVFDVQRMASFHAIIDLVGGYHSLDWSDVKFFYNSNTNKIEPVGYESFSIRKTVQIAGQRTPDDFVGIEADYHNKLFSDSVFFKAYIEALERICDEKYFNEFRKSIQSDLNEKLGVLATEWPYRKFTFDLYYENIELIRHNLELPKPFHAFLDESNDSTLTISLAAVSDFPIELIDLNINDKELIQFNNAVLAPKHRKTFAHYTSFVFSHTSKKVKDIIIRARIPGSTNVFEVEVNEYPSYTSDVDFERVIDKDVNISSHPLIKFDKSDSSYYFNKKNISINASYFIDSKSKLKVISGQNISFDENASFLVEGELQLTGGKNMEVIVTSFSENAIINLEGGELIASNVIFPEGDKIIQSNNSSIFIEKSVIADVEDCFLATKLSKVIISNCYSGSVQCFGDFDRSIVKMSGLVCKKGHDFIRSHGSQIEMVNSKVSSYSLFTNLDHISQFSMWSSSLNENDVISKLNNSSTFNSFGGDMGAADIGFEIDLLSNTLGESRYVMYKTASERIGHLEKRK